MGVYSLLAWLAGAILGALAFPMWGAVLGWGIACFAIGYGSALGIRHGAPPPPMRDDNTSKLGDPPHGP